MRTMKPEYEKLGKPSNYANYATEDLFTTLRAERLFRFFKKSKIPKYSKILDIGLGAGQLLNMLQNDGFINIHGCDISEICILNAIDKGIQNLVKADVDQGLPYKHNSFDVIICAEVLEHLCNPHILLQEIRRVLKVDALSFFTFPLELNITQRLLILLGRNVHDPLEIGGHIHFFKPNDADRILNENGFRIIDKRYYCFGSKLDSYVPRISFMLSNYFPNLFAGNVVLKTKVIK